MKRNLFKGASPILGAVALASTLAFAAPAHAFAQQEPAGAQTQTVDATALASIVQAAIDALPEDATEAQIEAAIAAAVASTCSR